MNYIIHLTRFCNLRCKYCYEKEYLSKQVISIEDIKALVDYEINSKSKLSILTFYGGEPLLEKKLVYETVNYIKSKKSKTKFYYSITTNGTLLDDEFIQFIKNNNFLKIGYSIDGTKESHNINRVTIDGTGSFDLVKQNAKKLLKEHKNTLAMMVITKNNIKYLKENVEYVLRLGFKSLNLQLDYLCDWDDEDLKIIKEQFNKVANIYHDRILKEEDIEIIIFDEKIKSHINKEYNCNKDCNLGIKNVNIGTNGNFYPCMQFVNDEKYIIGNCKNGIDFESRQKIIEQSGKENEICKECPINKRCKHTCACKNYLITKDINELAPIICEFERIIIDTTDKMAARLYKEDSKLFMQKYYNKNYELLHNLILKGDWE